MALNASLVWRIRTGGNALNGGGYDAAVAGAGTDYTDQDSPQLSLTDFATSGAGSTTLTSATGGFTAAMIGNILRIASGTNFQAGYYMITGQTDTNTVTLDRTPSSGGAGSGGVGRVGGAFAGLDSLMGTGNNGLTTPTLTTPLAAGHVIYLRGAGSDDPSGIDYDYKGTTTSGYFSSNPNGSSTAGRIKLIGYNGRPHLRYSGILLFLATGWYLENLKLTMVASATFPNYGVFGPVDPATGVNNNLARNLIVEANGNDAVGLVLAGGMDLDIRNTGGGAAGTGAGIVPALYGAVFIGCSVDGIRGDSYRSGPSGLSGIFIFCLSNNPGRDHFRIVDHAGEFSSTAVVNCTADGKTVGSDGVEMTTAGAIYHAMILNTIIANVAGYGINCSTGSTALNDRRKSLLGSNDLYSCTSGLRNAITADSTSLNVDPQFVDAANKNYAVGSALKAGGFPSAMRGTVSTSYVDIGAVQRQEAGGSGLARIIGG